MASGAIESLRCGKHRVTMGDVDAAAILYFAAPYRWLEELLTGWWKAQGHPLSEMLRTGVGAPCVASGASYPNAVRLDDELTLSLHPSSIGRTSFSVTAIARRVDNGAEAVRVTSWHVWAQFAAEPQTALRPAPLPEWLRAGLTATPLVEPAVSRGAA